MKPLTTSDQRSDWLGPGWGSEWGVLGSVGGED